MTTIPQSGLLEMMQHAYFVLVIMSTSIQTQWFHLSRWMWKLFFFTQFVPLMLGDRKWIHLSLF